MQFDAFCKVRGWSCWQFDLNPKNRKQYLACVVDDKNEEQYFIIAESGSYYHYVGPKQWEAYEYVLQEEEGKTNERTSS